MEHDDQSELLRNLAAGDSECLERVLECHGHLLVAITLNRMRRVLRHEHAVMRDVDCEDSDIQEVADSGHRPEGLDLSSDPLEQLLASDLLREVLESLPEKDRQIIHYLIMGCTHEEAAHRAGCGKRHVDQVLAKARRRLKELEDDE